MTISDCQSPGAHCFQERTLEGVPGEFLYIKKAPPSQLERGNITRTPAPHPLGPWSYYQASGTQGQCSGSILVVGGALGGSLLVSADFQVAAGERAGSQAGPAPGVGPPSKL